MLPNEGEVYICIYLYLIFSMILMFVIIVDYRLWIMNVLGVSLSGSINRLGFFGKYACVCMGMCR